MKTHDLAEILLSGPNIPVFIEIPYNDTWQGAFDTRTEPFGLSNIREFGGRKAEPKMLITWN